MALSIPTIMSNVGANKEIIEDGKNGYLANDDNEWFDKISDLINSKSLRAQIGQLGRKTVVDNYSVESQKERYLACFKSVLNK